MLLRRDGGSLVLIPQPAHAWLSGQMARAWGHGGFARPEPFEPVCLGIEQHDIGWQDEDRRPRFDAATGGPAAFWQVPTADHAALWGEGVRRAMTFGRYPALLVSLHGTTIYEEKVDKTQMSSAEAAIAHRFVEEQRTVQAAILASLRTDPRTTASADPETVERNRCLLRTLDALSLHACWSIDKEVVIDGAAPGRGADGSLTLRPSSRQANEILVRPWPFGVDRLVLAIEGRRLAPSFRNQEALQEAYDAAPPLVLEVVLGPGG